ncbi:mRNA-decapping protein g5R [Pyramimonas orientalis virus]|uniref:mRNA-decapping protein g5R n=1 Tax=Pyramimonas orientalis virus 01B TaxID=3134525 RepID=A0A7L9AXC0_9VIRU|nr:mRNA-decapping protein g5R [Pyramimonas orientalis virus]QOI90179.1 mRNA-decapping protein g5R [Pyramimonas orientalis virus]
MENHKEHSKKDIICINCGYTGHTSKNCNFPITSFGILAHKFLNDQQYYLMVQRKDTLCYTEFIRGKYDIKNIRYISKLLRNMTKNEHTKLLTNDFDYLWNSMWVNNSNNMRKEYNSSTQKFKALKSGYKIKSNSQIIDVSLETLIGDDCLPETEWEFPKGRRKINEKDIHCALREFEEESGIKKTLLIVEDNCKQYEEIFIGNNNLRYRNIFYLASYTKNNIHEEFFSVKNNDQIKEIRDVKWFQYDEVCQKIVKKVEKFELFKRIHSQILKTKNI